MTKVPQPVTDNSMKVRQLSHYQVSGVAGEAGQAGTWTLQLVLDQGAQEEVLTLDEDDADKSPGPARQQQHGALRHRTSGPHVRHDTRRQGVSALAANSPVLR